MLLKAVDVGESPIFGIHWETENKGLDEVGCKERLGESPQNYPEMFHTSGLFLSFLQRDKVRSDTKNVAGIG